MINLQINNKCNQFCIFCNTQKLLLDKTWKETTFEEIIKMLKEGIKKSDSVNFTGGGEATLNKNLPQLISYAKFLGYKHIFIETNGMLFSYNKFAKKIKKSGLDYFVVSLHSHKSEISDKITQTKGGYEKTIKGIHNMQTLGFDVIRILHTINKHNYKDLKSFIKFSINDLKINNITLSFIRPIEGNKLSLNATPKFIDIQEDIIKALKYGITENVNILISDVLGIPMCFLNGFEKHSTEFLNYKKLGSKPLKEIMIKYGKVKSIECKKCTLTSACSGISKEYSELHGLKELKPIKKSIKSLFKK